MYEKSNKRENLIGFQLMNEISHAVITPLPQSTKSLPKSTGKIPKLPGA